MSAWVLDTSAILAYLVQETGADRVEGMIEDGAAVSTLTVQETTSKLVQLGLPRDAAEEAIVSVGLNVHDVTFALAIEAVVCPLKLGPSRSMGFAQFRRTRDGQEALQA